ncbi:hypothetical protein U3516DRAFT_594132 [Neocallimastix sp. 'constans']
MKSRSKLDNDNINNCINNSEINNNHRISSNGYVNNNKNININNNYSNNFNNQTNNCSYIYSKNCSSSNNQNDNYSDNNNSNDNYYTSDKYLNDPDISESTIPSKSQNSDIIYDNSDELDSIEEAKFDNDSHVSIDVEDINEVIDKINYYIEKLEIKENNNINHQSNYISSTNSNSIEKLKHLANELKSIEDEESQLNSNYNHFNMDTLDYKKGYVDKMNRVKKKNLPYDNNEINSLPNELDFEYNDTNNQNNLNENNNSITNSSEYRTDRPEVNKINETNILENNSNILSCAERANQTLLNMLSDDVKKLFDQKVEKKTNSNLSSYIVSKQDKSNSFGYNPSSQISDNNYNNSINSIQIYNSNEKVQENSYSDISSKGNSLNYDKILNTNLNQDFSEDYSQIEEDITDDFVYHPNDIREKFPLIYHSANLSEIASKFRKMIPLVTHIKDSIEYMDSFSGHDAVTTFSIILGNNNRKIAQTVGQTLEEQGMFHDVIYLHKLLDSRNHFYQFKDLAKPIAILERKETAYINSENQEIKQRKLDEFDKDELDELNPCGVLTNMAQCYSPTCTKNSPCYSCTCPRRRIMERVTKEMTAGRFSDMNSTIALQSNWSTSIGKFYVNKLKFDEVKRQEIIYEFILTEKEYILDLKYVIKYMIEPLRAGKVRGVTAQFVNKVFSNIEEIYKTNQIFYENLRQVQKRKPILESIGDTVLNYVNKFTCYLQYGKNQPSAKQELQVQRNRNSSLDRFLMQCQKNPCFRHLPVESFLARPTTRLGRYPMFLHNILKNTPEFHRDQILLKETIKTLESILKQVNDLAGKETNRLKIEQWAELLKFEKNNDLSLIQLNDPKREYIREGKLSYLTSSYFTLDTKQDVILLLLDNCLVIINKNKKSMNYHIQGSPIPLSLLSLYYSDQKYSLVKNKNDKNSISYSTLDSNTSTLTIRNYDRCMFAVFNPTGYILTIKHIGHCTYNFYTTVYSEQKAWVQAIQNQLNKLPKPIAKEVCFFKYTKKDVPLRSLCRLKDGALLLSNDYGLYILTEQSSLKLLIPLLKITQIIALEEFDILFILSNHNVYAYSISLILKNIYNNINNVKLNKRICNNISFISMGSCDNRFLLCCAKVSNKKTTINIFEPRKFLINATYQKKYRDLYLTGEVVQQIKTFFIKCESHAIHFLRHSLCVACSRGFKILDINSLTEKNLLNLNDISFRNIFLSKYLPMNMFKTEKDDFLLCYDKIGFFIDKNGGHSRSNILFKWYNQPKAFAYSSPYIYTFTSDFIAIWNESDPSQPHQVITGKGIQLHLSENSPDIVYSKISKGKQCFIAIKILNTNSSSLTSSSNTDNTNVINSISSIDPNTAGTTLTYNQDYQTKNNNRNLGPQQNQIQNHTQYQNQSILSSVPISTPPRVTSNKSNIQFSRPNSIQSESKLYSSSSSSSSCSSASSLTNPKRFSSVNPMNNYTSSSNIVKPKRQSLGNPIPYYHASPPNIVNPKRLSSANSNSSFVNPKRLSHPNPIISNYSAPTSPVNPKRLSSSNINLSYTSSSSSTSLSSLASISSQSSSKTNYSYVPMKQQNIFSPPSSSRISTNALPPTSMHNSNNSKVHYSNHPLPYSNSNNPMKTKPSQPNYSYSHNKYY